MTVRDSLLPINASLSILVLLARSQQDHIPWAPAATSLALLAWTATGSILLAIHHHFLLQNRRSIAVSTLKFWGITIAALQPPLPDAVLLIPVSITISALCLNAHYDRVQDRLPQLPFPVTANTAQR
ncbi:hypothetical protein QQZ08_007535 [Neonectria magnoliae]|uniref:Uncharacterized protein n=1 Tax=Neonectria magnoliae TaxID=2732573 RepID=A0ABR1HXM3_9HYPO